MTEINEHFWVNANLAAYLAGGLEDEERARFESHVSACGKCLEELKDAQQTEEKLAKLFENDRPRPGLEDRVIRAIRLAPEVRRAPIPQLRVLQAAAAVLLLGGVGYAVERSQDIDSANDSLQMSRGAVLSEARANSATQLGREIDRSEDAQQAMPKDAAELALRANNKYSEEVEQYSKSKGDSMMGLGGATREAEGRYGGRRKAGIASMEPPSADPAAPAPAAKPSGPAESYRDDAPARVAEPGYFRPGDFKAAGAGEAEKKALKELAAGAEAAKVPVLAVADAIRKVNQERQDQANPNRKIIRTGEMEFEIDQFDSAVDKITKIVIEDGGYIGTINSDRLPNGKVRGTIAVRIPPDRLETLVLKLRALGDLKSQRIASEDVTKQYTDTESQLRAARTMEARLIEIIKSGKGEIKDILLAEQELGKWREKIEVFEGQLRYWAAQVAMSTLNLTLYEKDIRTPAGVTETESVTASLEADDVEKTYKEVLAAIAEIKGRVTTSSLQKHQAGQFAGRIIAEIAPENSVALRDRLAQLARVAGLDVQRLQNVDGGQGRPVDAKVKRNDSIFNLSIYNLVNVAPRETIRMHLATAGIEDVYRVLAQRVERLGGRMVSSVLNRQPGDRTTGELRFEIPEKDADAFNLELKTTGEVFDYDVAINPDAANVTRTKRGFHVTLFGLGAVQARETASVSLAAGDVSEAFKALKNAVTELKGRLLQAQLNENDRKNVSATLHFEVLSKDADAVEAAVRAAGWTMSRSATRAQDQATAIDAKRAFALQIYAAASLGPRTQHEVAVEVKDVDKAVADAKTAAAEAKGRVVEDHVARDRSGKIVGKLAFEVPATAATAVVERLKGAGVVRVLTVTKNDNAPEGDLAFARIDLTLSNAELLIPSDEGFGKQIRDGLANVFSAAGFSIRIFLIGLLVVGPWALILWAAAKLWKRLRRSDPPAAPAA